MNCRKVSRRLSAYIENDLSSSESIRIEEHLKSCGFCRRKLADLKLILETAGQLDRHEPGPYFVNRVMCSIGQKKSPAEILSNWRYRLSLSGVAFVVAASLTFFVIGPPATVMVETTGGDQGIRAVTSPATIDSSEISAGGFPVPPEVLKRDLALEEKPVPESLKTEPEVLSRRYIQPVSIKNDSNKAF